MGRRRRGQPRSSCQSALLTELAWTRTSTLSAVSSGRSTSSTCTTPGPPLGADRVIDYTRVDYTKEQERYDLVVDVAGGHSWRAIQRVLGPEGRLVIVGAHGSRRQLRHIAAIWIASLGSKDKVKFFVANFNNLDLQTLANLLESGALKPAIDRAYELDEAQDALRTFGEGHVRGKLVLTI
jgi:NADPH:quinone reductase-like Zn-dependent oxidoreductase